jgi:hypothetical protein
MMIAPVQRQPVWRNYLQIPFNYLTSTMPVYGKLACNYRDRGCVAPCQGFRADEVSEAF